MLDWALWVFLIICGLGVPLGTPLWIITVVLFVWLTARLAGRARL